MVLATSTFRVLNAREPEVRAAFAARPRQIEQAPGFLGLEVFTDADDPSIVRVVTRWSDRSRFTAWHGGAADGRSHDLMPPGLTLDHVYTRVEVSERLEDDAPIAALERGVADAAAVVARHALETRTLYLLWARDGVVEMANAALEARVAAAPLAGRRLQDLLCASDAARLEAFAHPGPRFLSTMALTLVAVTGERFTVRATVAGQQGRVVLVGEPLIEDEQRLSATLLETNKELAVLAREHARQGHALRTAQAELERTHKTLKDSFWHLQKIQEVLPVCVNCHKVKTGDGTWNDFVRFFHDHSDFLSHGYCPDCLADAVKELGFSDDDERG